MQPEIQISVCITTFNSEGYIKNALQSVINQKTNFNFEIIIADDASEDNTVEEIKSIILNSDFKFFKLITSTINKGVNYNLLNAFKVCRGSLIALLDADDLWIDENKLQSQFNILTANKSLDFTYSNYTYSYSTDNKKVSQGMPLNFIHPFDQAFEKFLLSPYICICTICFKNELLDFKLIEEFIDQKFISQDYPLLLFFCKNFKGYYDKKITTKIIIKRDSLSRPVSLEKKLLYFDNIFSIGTYFINLYGVNNKIRNIRKFKHNFKYLLALWLSNDFKRIKTYSENLNLSDIIKYKPKSIYIYFASKNKYLYKIFRPWVLRKRAPGK